MLLETAIYLWFQRSAFVAGWGLDRWTFSRLSVYSLRDDTGELVGSDVWSGVDHDRRHTPLTRRTPKDPNGSSD